MSSNKIEPRVEITKESSPSTEEKEIHSWKGRFFKVLSYIKTTLTSFGSFIARITTAAFRAIFKSHAKENEEIETAGNAKKATKGEKQTPHEKQISHIGKQELKIQPQHLTSSLSEQVVSLKHVPYLPHVSKKDLQTIQTELDNRHIPLTCREFTPPPPSQRNTLNQEAIDEYLDAVRKDFKTSFPHGPKSLTDQEAGRLIAAKRRFFENTQCITYEDLGKALSASTKKLNSLLGGQEYAVGYAERKSQKWIAELALPFMNKTPQKAFTVEVQGSGAESEQGKLSDDIKNFVVFDDSSYSGSQMMFALRSLVEELQNLPTQQPRKIYYVIPFMSERAEQNIKKEWDELRSNQSPDKLASFPELCLITSDKKLTTFSDVFSKTEFNDLGKFEEARRERKPLNFQKVPQDKKDLVQDLSYMSIRAEYSHPESKCLSFMEWKTPDAVSVPPRIYGELYEDKILLFLNPKFVPPYKKSPS